MVVVLGARRDVLEDVDQAGDDDVDPDLLAHLPVQGGQHRLAELDLSPRASPTARGRAARCAG